MQLQSGTPQYFLDDEWIAHQQRLVRRWLPAKVYPEPAIRPELPWEGRTITLFGTVLPEDGGGFRMYYSNMERQDQHDKVFVATSPDGLKWEKPELGLVEWRGSRANNILLAPEHSLDSPSVIHEPADGDRAYKMLVFENAGGGSWDRHSGLYAYVSADGWTWTRPSAECLLAGDRTTVMATRPGEKYVAYLRHRDMWQHVGGRAIYISESDDFVSWTEPEPVLAPDLRDEPDIEFYGMSVFERHGWLFGLLEYWDSSEDCIEVHLAVSRDGRSWARPCQGPFIGATFDWNRKWSSCATNGPIILGEQMVFYFGGRWVSHHFDSAHQQGSIGYASLPLDRFCALEASTGGMFVTPPFTWPGGDLALNADTREVYTSHPIKCDGSVTVEVLDGSGAELLEWCGGQAATFVGNTHCRARVMNQLVKWPGDRGLAGLAGRDIRLRFTLKHARLFTFGATAER